MNATRHSHYTALDRRWADDVTRELAIRGASGRAIGEALAIADAHCAEGHEAAVDAFGPAADYAASVRLRATDTEGHSLAAQVRAAWPSLLGLAGMLLALRCIDAVQGSTVVPIRWGDLIGVVGIIVLAVSAVRRLDVVVHHPVLSWVVGTALFTGIIGVQVATTAEIAQVPLLGAGVAAGAALVGSGIWGTLAGPGVDLVEDPRPGAAAPKGWRAFGVVTNWLFLILTVLAGCVFLLVPRG
jgi:hypothetical protein